MPNSSNDIPFETIANRQVLVVDDVKLLRDLITSILRQAGFNNIEHAENGQEAMLKVTDNPPDIIILDLMMPIMDGMEVCRLVREIEDTASIPIIVQTAMHDNEERLKAFAAGASDLVTKPVNALELVIRTKLHLKNLILTENREKYRARVADELATAKDVQQNILPSPQHLREIREQTGLNISSVCQPSSELGGDFWGARILANGSIGFYVTDFSGHGVVSALNTIRLHTLLFNVGEAWQKPDQLLSDINQNLCDMLPTGQYATMIIGLISPENNTLSYAGAAAPPPIYGEWEKPEKFSYLDTTGLPLGVSKIATYDLQTVPFTKNHLLFSFSDALIETKLNDGTFLEGEELIKLVKDLTNSRANPQLLNQLISSFFENGGDDLRDDLTAICFDYL
ncbi:PP2C family protein-serine/threonine phosphatase [Kiloniella spongiae]|uniref:PP2C family protein-serine/threonine phosphatase n=1 Tax=Kiloniella spongiae TaxID=1489064 RepID=UPI00069ABCD9|nr:fused response regulator/phosphatase [Kiloniella spongiae]